MRKEENLARQTSSKDSMTINLGKSAASYPESDSDRFRFVFLFKDTKSDVYFSLSLCYTTHNLYREYAKRETFIALIETGTYD